MTTLILDLRHECQLLTTHTFVADIAYGSLEKSGRICQVTPPEAASAAAFGDYRVGIWDEHGSLLHSSKAVMSDGHFRIYITPRIESSMQSMSIVGETKTTNGMRTLSLEMTINPDLAGSGGPATTWSRELWRVDMQTMGYLPFLLRAGDTIRVEHAKTLVEAFECFDQDSIRLTAHGFNRSAEVRNSIEFDGEDLLVGIESSPAGEWEVGRYDLEAEGSILGRTVEANCHFIPHPFPEAHPDASEVVRSRE